VSEIEIEIELKLGFALLGFAWLCLALLGFAWICLALLGLAWLCCDPQTARETIKYRANHSSNWPIELLA
jgi:hypothetical protein